ncbi:MAG: bifunctional non-ous end joining protein LigD [Thermoleophilaceae bacterium]|jgi:bifunctional non-homologous end joining protein LigD|nr:bifunctional non-ous end joining protein LigD [Thermoleophilaceae bacterium]
MATPEPAAGDSTATADLPRFVIQEHSATRLHWDLRLEHDGVLLSWAIPNGIPQSPDENRKAVHTEDHPLEYLDFHGEIPKGNYGAGTMTIWDRGTYVPEKIEDRKVIAEFHGERVRGRYALFQTGSDPKDWMIHRMDPPDDPAREPMPERIVPMLARSGPLPSDEERYGFEIKWDGMRAIVYSLPGRLRIQGRNLNDITAQWPELRRMNRALHEHEAVLDGEIVAFDADGKPSFARLQRRMHLSSESQIQRTSKSLPATFVAFDLLHLDGHSLLDLPYTERRERLEALDLNGSHWRTPPSYAGEGRPLLEATRQQGLEGVVAKRLDSPYCPGQRSSCWVKVKNKQRAELVVGGYLPGERKVGAVLLGRYDDDGRLRYAGRAGSGLKESDVEELLARTTPRDESPFEGDPRPPRGSRFVEPELEVEAEFTDFTDDGVMRHPTYKGMVEKRPLKKPGAYEATVDGRTLRLSNYDKVLWPAVGFTKGQMIEYYTRIAPVLVPHLHDRPLTLKRYPNGVEGQHFYEKQCPSHRPPWVETAEVSTGRKNITFCLCNDTATLAWLANLADIELHTSLSLAEPIERPTMMVFDLDPGAPEADIVQCCQVSVWLREIFEPLGLESFAKTSGSKGLQVYVPLNVPEVTYDDTKPFAKAVAELLEKQHPELVVSRMSKELRPGKVLVDWSQNDEHKTTVNVYSLRARERPTVSAPVTWAEVDECLEAGDPSRLVFEQDEVLRRVERDGDIFAPVLTLVQELPRF